jgi:hypothetical protein
MKYFNPGLMPMALFAAAVAIAVVCFVITSGRMA